MATVNPKILGYVIPDLREKFERFKADGGYTSDSKALNGLLDEFFSNEDKWGNSSKYATADEVGELKTKLDTLVESVSEIHKALEALTLNNTQIVKPPILPKSTSSMDSVAFASSLDSDSLEQLYPTSLDSDLDESLTLLAQTIDDLESDIEDRLFAIWQGIAIRQAGDNFYGHLVPLDMIHELGFQSMPMDEFLQCIASVEASDLELVPSNENPNYSVGGHLAWSLTFHANGKPDS